MNIFMLLNIIGAVASTVALVILGALTASTRSERRELERERAEVFTEGWCQGVKHAIKTVQTVADEHTTTDHGLAELQIAVVDLQALLEAAE